MNAHIACFHVGAPLQSRPHSEIIAIGFEHRPNMYDALYNLGESAVKKENQALIP
jgi:hypothetical protein